MPLVIDGGGSGATSTLLAIKTAFWEHQGLLWSGTATGGSADYLTDSDLQDLGSETFPHPIKGKQLRMTGGANDGALRRIVKLDESEPNIFPNRPFSLAVASGDTYQVWGVGIHGGQSLTSLINEAIRPQRPVKQTEVTIVDNQRRYDISSFVRTRDDIVNVWKRHYDTESTGPYTLTPLEWWAEDYGGAGTTGTTLIIDPLMSNDYLELWVEHRTRFAPFASDSDTLDAKYVDWLAYEAILLYATRGQLRPNSDGIGWNRLIDLAVAEVRQGRAKFCPAPAMRIRAVGPLVGMA